LRRWTERVNRIPAFTAMRHIFPASEGAPTRHGAAA
jgi:hypothetical protein